MVVLPLSMLGGCGGHEPAKPLPRTVEIIVIGQADGLMTKTYSGQVVSRYLANYGFRIGGAITSRPVEIGQRVVAGDVLARIDARDVDVNVRSAAAQAYGAQAQVTTQDADLARARKLLAEGFISPAEFDRNRASAASAQAQLRSAREQETGATQQRSYTVLRATRTGVVTAVSANVGEVVAAGQPVVKVESPGALEVAVSVPEGETAQFSISRLSVRLWSGNRALLPGTLRTLSSSANPQTRTFDARVAFTPPPIDSTIGGTAEVVMSRATASSDIRVPLTAIVQKQGQPAVWIVSGRPAVVRPRAVRVRSTQANDALISAGLRPGERIVSIGGQFLSPGQEVRPVPSTAERNR